MISSHDTVEWIGFIKYINCRPENCFLSMVRTSEGKGHTDEICDLYLDDGVVFVCVPDEHGSAGSIWQGH